MGWLGMKELSKFKGAVVVASAQGTYTVPQACADLIVETGTVNLNSLNSLQKDCTEFRRIPSRTVKVRDKLQYC